MQNVSHSCLCLDCGSTAGLGCQLPCPEGASAREWVRPSLRPTAGEGWLAGLRIKAEPAFEAWRARPFISPALCHRGPPLCCERSMFVFCALPGSLQQSYCPDGSVAELGFQPQPCPPLNSRLSPWSVYPLPSYLSRFINTSNFTSYLPPTPPLFCSLSPSGWDPHKQPPRSPQALASHCSKCLEKLKGFRYFKHLEK